MPARRPKEDSNADPLTALLLALRGNLGQEEAGALADPPVSQSKITRAESGIRPLSAPDAERYARALGATEDQVVELLRLTSVRRGKAYPRGNQLIVGPLVQSRIDQLIAQSASLRAWVHRLVPGLLQTEAYTLAVVAPRVPDNEWWRPRRTQRRILDDADREAHLIIAESALRWGLGTPALMVDQMSHLIAESERRPGLRLGVVPVDGIRTIKAPNAGFYVYGDHTASQATDRGTAFLTGDVVEQLAKMHGELAGIALHDDDARQLLDRIRRQFKRQAQ